jgi:hypothetical protein
MVVCLGDLGRDVVSPPQIDDGRVSNLNGEAIGADVEAILVLDFDIMYG